MAASTGQYECLIRSAARRLKDHQRRLSQAEVATQPCGGNPRAAGRRLGRGRDAVATGLDESNQASVVSRTSPPKAPGPAKRRARSRPPTSAPSSDRAPRPTPS